MDKTLNLDLLEDIRSASMIWTFELIELLNCCKEQDLEVAKNTLKLYSNNRDSILTKLEEVDIYTKNARNYTKALQRLLSSYIIEPTKKLNLSIRIEPTIDFFQVDYKQRSHFLDDLNYVRSCLCDNWVSFNQAYANFIMFSKKNGYF